MCGARSTTDGGAVGLSRLLRSELSRLLNRIPHVFGSLSAKILAQGRVGAIC